ncbi:helix-turn-helix transcriptional regulator [Pseudorhodoferax sp.]|uniref:helix-turn-helix transcriptional regulator n=1 Tax=Pseudorhodoferax sp. TaxID=1993553 RepID=UPI002DD6B389|nr:helix-turn-helix transcriptional regulator [Pseudorhodoferax sp.]
MVALPDALGCSAARLHASQDLVAGGLKIYRRQSTDRAMGQVATAASDRGYLVGISLAPGHVRRVLRGRQGDAHHFDHGSVYIRSFADDYRADMRSPFDFVLLELAPSLFDAGSAGHCGRRVAGLRGLTGVADPVLSALGRALLPALARPHEASALFLGQMATVIETHLVERHGDGLAGPAPAVGGLAPRHERLAKEMLASRLDGAVSVAAVALACGLSRSHFARAFRASTGQSPTQWLQSQRVEQACALMARPGATLAAIAAACGFADQSHFARVFRQIKGVAPSRWRGA